MSEPGNFVPPEPGGFVPPEPGGFVPPEPGGFVPPEPGGFVPEFAEAPGATGGQTAAGGPTRRKASRRSRDQLGIVWLRGTLHLAVMRQRKTLGRWSSPEPVRTVEEFAAALDTALAELKFQGTDTFLVFEGEQFVHQPETAPSFSPSATKAYLQSRVARYAKEHGPVLWVAQPAIGPKEERTWILHLMAQEFYGQLRRVFLPRRLDLTRIFPMVVPVQREMNGFPISHGLPALVAAEVAEATVIVVALAGGPVLFTRTILASLEEAPARVAIEINRSLLYAKQQFNVSVDRIWLATRTGRASDEVTAKCGAGKVVMVLPTSPDEWVQSAARVARTHPVNLIAGYIQQKRRDQFLRLGLMIVGWLGLAVLGTKLWEENRSWQVEKQRLEAVQARAPELEAERDRLVVRNKAVQTERVLRQRLGTEALPPVPSRLLAYLAGVLPADASLSTFAVKWHEENSAWTFQCEGQIAGDDESAREAIGALQRLLAKGPLRIRFTTMQGGAGRASFGGSFAGASQQRFTLEGTLFEN
jgi:hypothetical protein